MLGFKGNWDDNLSLNKFAYNIIYHSNTGMVPYEDYIRENVDPILVGSRLEKQGCMDLTWCRKPFKKLS